MKTATYKNSMLGIAITLMHAGIDASFDEVQLFLKDEGFVESIVEVMNTDNIGALANA